MKRSEKEIKMICEEIKVNVTQKILNEEAEALHCKLREKGILCYEPWFGGYFWTEQRLIDAQKAYLNVQKAFNEYRKKVEERS